MAKQTYTTGQVLTAAQMTTLQTNDFNQTVSAKTASYTLVAADAGTRITMSNAGATTVTVNTAIFAAGDTLEITNIGVGVCTVTAGTATVSTSSSLNLKQFDSGQLYFTSTGVAIFFMADAADSTSPLTTKGDLYGFSTLDARIPIGANNTVLTADSAQALGLKWAAPAAASVTFAGALASTRVVQNISNNTFTTVPLATQSYSTNSIHSTTVNNTRFTIPSGFTGKWLFYGTGGFDSMPSGSIQTRFNKNGALVSQGIFTGFGGSGISSASISVGLNLTAGDFIELVLFQNSGGTETTMVSGTEDFIFMGCTFLGA